MLMLNGLPYIENNYKVMLYLNFVVLKIFLFWNMLLNFLYTKEYVWFQNRINIQLSPGVDLHFANLLFVLMP